MVCKLLEHFRLDSLKPVTTPLPGGIYLCIVKGMPPSDQAPY